MGECPTLLQRAIDRKRILKEVALAYFWADDWHGVADAMMDLREVDVEITLRTEGVENG